MLSLSSYINIKAAYLLPLCNYNSFKFVSQIKEKILSITEISGVENIGRDPVGEYDLFEAEYE